LYEYLRVNILTMLVYKIKEDLKKL